MVTGRMNFELQAEIAKCRQQIILLKLKPFKSAEDKAQLQRLKERILHLELQKMIQY